MFQWKGLQSHLCIKKYLRSQLSPLNKWVYFSLIEGLSRELSLEAWLHTVLPEDPGAQSLCFVLQPKVRCGLFGISEDYIEKYQSLDERFIKNKASTFFFESAGESMSPLIRDQDILIVDRSLQPLSGQVVVAHVSGVMVCKRLVKKNNDIVLTSDNEKFKPVKVTEEMNLIIFGVVRAIVRELTSPL